MKELERCQIVEIFSDQLMRFYKNSINISIMLPVLIALSGGGGDWSESADSHRILRLPKRADFLFRQIVIAIWWFHPFASQFFFHNKNLKLWGRCETLKVLYFVFLKKNKVKSNFFLMNRMNEIVLADEKMSARGCYRRPSSASRSSVTGATSQLTEFFFHSFDPPEMNIQSSPPGGTCEIEDAAAKTLWLCAVETDNENILGR